MNCFNAQYTRKTGSVNLDAADTDVIAWTDSHSNDYGSFAATSIVCLLFMTNKDI